MAKMVTVDDILSIGSTPGTNPGEKKDPVTGQTQAIINLTDVLKLVAIRDGKRAS
jgi:hypothetical protein